MDTTDKNKSIMDAASEHDRQNAHVKEFQKQDQVSAENISAVTQVSSSHHKDSSGEVSMEASISSDDVIRAGGFGARDDISSFLPSASDSTDFEASLLDARNYEEPEETKTRPGLGWTGAGVVGPYQILGDFGEDGQECGSCHIRWSSQGHHARRFLCPPVLSSIKWLRICSLIGVDLLFNLL